MGAIANNLARVWERIEVACRRVGRSPRDVTLIGVTKTVPLERIQEALDAGLHDLGENYVQEAIGKMDALRYGDVHWHFIGRLQTNKAKMVVGRFLWIHTVDRLKLARELDRRANKTGRPVQVLIQVHQGDETTKGGCSPGDLVDLYREMAGMEMIRVRGLMSLPPYLPDVEAVRPYFRELRALLDRLRDEAKEPEVLTELSMGMSHDFEVAVEEGATMVRVGTAIFGRRPG